MSEVELKPLRLLVQAIPLDQLKLTPACLEKINNLIKRSDSESLLEINLENEKFNFSSNCGWNPPLKELWFSDHDNQAVSLSRATRETHSSTA